MLQWPPPPHLAVSAFQAQRRPRDTTLPGGIHVKKPGKPGFHEPAAGSTSLLDANLHAAGFGGIGTTEGHGRLALDAATLRLAVTETVTAPRRIQHKLARDQAWKLGFVALRNALQGEAIRPFKPVPTAWQGGSFADYCRLLAGREGLALPDEVDWARWEAAGEQRRGEVRRLELVRHGFRRALEVWLVMDLALGLEEAGFEVEVGTFCDRALTPRNLMVLAERRSG